jgi:hypothetical protein
MRIYKIVQAIGKTRRGGLNCGFFSFSYHSSGFPIEPMRNPNNNGITIHKE